MTYLLHRNENTNSSIPANVYTATENQRNSELADSPTASDEKFTNRETQQYNSYIALTKK